MESVSGAVTVSVYLCTLQAGRRELSMQSQGIMNLLLYLLDIQVQSQITTTGTAYKNSVCYIIHRKKHPVRSQSISLVHVVCR